MGTTVQAGSSILVWVACLLLAFPATVAGHKVIQPEVDTPLGRVRGRQVGVKGTDHLVNVFLGIPFAQAPLGPLRFSAPLPPQPWEGVRDASTNPPMCLQDVERMSNSRFTLNEKLQIYSISEDCLILNIYSPTETIAGARLPVMVWIHGGSLVVGSATSHDGSALAAYGNVVVVTVQYRLGIFGFLSTGDKHMPGNRGLLDVVAALRWVQENIAPYGGDPGCVTIFGNSAGGMIVSSLVLSPMSAGLFHRAISQSGVITSQIVKEKNPWLEAQTFANSLGCSSVSSAELVQCLLQKEGKDLNNQNNVNISYIINDSFFPRSPEKLLTEKQFPTVPYLLGVNNHEFGWLMLKVWKMLDKMEHLSQEDLLDISRPFLALLDIPPEIMSTVIDEYLDNGSDAPAIRYAFQELLSDIVFVIPTLNFSRHLQAFPEATEEEKQLSLTMMAQWTRFAYTGNPNGKGLPPWPQLNQLEQYLEIGLEPRTGVKLKKKRLQFWEETLPRKIQEWHQQQSRKAPEEL
ncbi:Ces3 [Phodopus roborovskii]|uniref:Ces3 protein n=1 Tax=Phodopus roborovskii TaxID=109678 RepID=A0AAU9ZZV2_PHORO|nr:Ces3 [Phodopus roborovskii]